jgi:hypothetical protein
MGVNGRAKGDAQDAFSLDTLLEAITDPSSSTSTNTDRLAKSLGIDHLPSKEEAIKQLQEQALAPVKDLSGELWRWQTYVYVFKMISWR